MKRCEKQWGGCWCPGAESNHRHADFQSAALPTELPGQLLGPSRQEDRWGDVDGVGDHRERVVYNIKFRPVQPQPALPAAHSRTHLPPCRSPRSCRSPIAARRCRSIVLAFLLDAPAGYDIGSRKPAVQVLVAAAPGAERVMIAARWPAAFRAWPRGAQRRHIRRRLLRTLSILVGHGFAFANLERLPNGVHRGAERARLRSSGSPLHRIGEPL
jgi:hypothetical protein